VHAGCAFICLLSSMSPRQLANQLIPSSKTALGRLSMCRPIWASFATFCAALPIPSVGHINRTAECSECSSPTLHTTYAGRAGLEYSSPGQRKSKSSGVHGRRLLQSLTQPSCPPGTASPPSVSWLPAPQTTQTPFPFTPCSHTPVTDFPL
jgi:hypothetical protein